MKINQEPKILVFAGSTRTGSLHRKLAALAAAELSRAGMDVTLADLRDYPMPLYDGDSEASQGVPENAARFKELVRAHDALVVASPEYNGSFSALLKNTIDWISRPAPGEGPLAVFRAPERLARPGGRQPRSAPFARVVGDDWHESSSHPGDGGEGHAGIR